jgi:HSP20 family protein
LSSGHEDDIEPFDWFRRFLGGSGDSSRAGGQFSFSDIFRGFEEIRREMERQFEEQFKNLQSTVPKDLVREFGNIRSPFWLGATGTTSAAESIITDEREPLADVVASDKEVKVVVEIQGVNKESIKINAYDNSLEIKSDDPQRKYHQVIDLPPAADIEKAKSSYRNGILEIIFKKKELTKPKGKQINIE